MGVDAITAATLEAGPNPGWNIRAPCAMRQHRAAVGGF